MNYSVRLMVPSSDRGWQYVRLVPPHVAYTLHCLSGRESNYYVVQCWNYTCFSISVGDM